MKILVFGAAGTGKTSLGKEIAKRTDFMHLDSDDYYWKPTAIPFKQKVPLKERNRNIKIDFEKTENIILSGSIVGWGAEWRTAFDLAVFITLTPEVRMKRLKKREIERYGDKLFTDKNIKENSKAFLNWAQQYDNPNFTGTTLKVHYHWIELLSCEVLKLDSEIEFNTNVEKVLLAIRKA